MPAEFDPTGRLADAAAKHGVHAVFGTIEPISAQAATAFNLIVMAYPDGREPARYRRTYPNGPWIYTGGKYWEFQYIPATTTRCSTQYMARSVWRCAARSTSRRSPVRWRCAAPNCCSCPRASTSAAVDTWRALLWARAIENLAVVVSTQNMVSARDRGLAIVAAPEEIIYESTGPATGLSMSAWTVCANCARDGRRSDHPKVSVRSRACCPSNGEDRRWRGKFIGDGRSAAQ